LPKVTFLPAGKAVQVRRGVSLLQAAEAAAVELPHNCGGACACTTCHLWVEEGARSLSEIDEREDDKLNEAAGLRENSRLGCQACLGDEDVVVRIPGNRIAS
jgi:ferredoxin, 2Fe-2S